MEEGLAQLVVPLLRGDEVLPPAGVLQLRLELRDLALEEGAGAQGRVKGGVGAAGLVEA